MKRTMIREASRPGAVKIQGFVENIRNRRTMMFLVVRDGSGSMQVTLEKEKHPEMSAVMEKLTIGSTVTVEGEVVANAHVKLGGREMLPESLQVESLAAALPLMEDSSIDTRLDYRWLDLRGERGRLIFQAQTEMADAFRRFLLERDFMEIHTPKLIAAASESGADVFELTYFDRKAYLSQSPQFYKQMAMSAGFERIFEIGPVFRAEKSHTRKHATEFTGFDVEMSWIESYRDVMALEEALLTDMLEKMKARFGGDILRLFGEEVVVPKRPFPVIALKDLYGELEKRYGYVPPESEQGDLTTEAEQMTERFAKEAFGHEFLFVTDFSADKRAFYHMRRDGVPQGYDLIWRGVEITTGAQREHRLDILQKQAAEKGLGEDIRFYTEFFRYGCPPHGGFGMGLDRMTMLLLRINIKEAMFLFRGPNRLTP